MGVNLYENDKYCLKRSFLNYTRNDWTKYVDLKNTNIEQICQLLKEEKNQKN